MKVDEKSKVIVVRGRAYRVCCPSPCGPRLEKSPDKYLDPDGTPRNAKRSAQAH
jgi:hypothetical protein